MTRFIAWATALFVFALSPSAFGWTFPIATQYYLINGFWSCSNKCYHLGQDIVPNSNPVGTEVHAICSGTVVEVNFNPDTTQQDYGGRVLIQCDTQTEPIVVLYGHLGKDEAHSRTNYKIFVHTGDPVSEGDIIGKLGATDENGGYAPHLHLGTHHGAYLGAQRECGRWQYAGYTKHAYTPADPCYCDIMDNWFDPMELMGLQPKNLRIVSGEFSPVSGVVDVTGFVWKVSAEGGHGAPITASVLITNPANNIEYPFVMDYTPNTSNPFWFRYDKTLQSEGQYTFRYRLNTCADSVEDTTARMGPYVRSASPPPPATCSAPILIGPRNNGIGMSVNMMFRWHSVLCGNVPADAYRLQVHTAANFPPECDDPAGQCSITLNERIANDIWYIPPLALAYSTRYYWRVRGGITGVMGGTWSDVWTFMTFASSPPPPPSCISEVCDGIDNNCNGRVDENLTRACSNECGNSGVQTCSYGTWNSCNANPCTPPPPPPCTPATCANLGKQCGSWGDGCGNTLNCGGCTSQYECNNNGQCVYTPPPPPSCTPSSDICDGIDNNCNGRVDENLTRACSNECGNWGTQTCNYGTWSSCNANPCSPPPPPPPPTCTPSTCSNLGKQCGSWGDGCGNTLNCGGCACMDACDYNGQCVPLPTACEIDQATGMCVPCGGEGNGCCFPCPHCNPGLYCDRSYTCRR